MAYLLGFLAATVSASAFPRGRGQCDLASFTPSQCRARISQHCANIWPMCDANAACHRAHLCLDEHDAASMSAAQPCFPGQAEGLLSRVAECLADCLPESQPPSCLSRGGLTVDWWFMYKLPGGLNYEYHDSTGEVHEDPTSINPMPNSSMGALGGTVAPVFAAKETGSEDLAYVVYNDQPPDGVQPLHTLPTYDKGAHAKGILATDGAVGFWLIHSIPKLPDLRGSQYSYSGSTKFGQSLLCLSLSAAGTEQVATQLRTAHPIIYAASVPSGLQAALPTLSRLTQGQFASVNTSSAPLQTRGVSGTAPLALMSHIKSPLWGANIYEQVVLPQLNEAGVGAMVWETWRRNPFTLDSFCPPEFPLPSLNAINISFPCGSGGVKCQYHYTSGNSSPPTLLCSWLLCPALNLLAS
jgi:deoxyribonuclease-2